MVFKLRQVQDVRIVKFKEILVINILIVRVQRRQIFFGVILDENLNWKSEISHVANKVAKELGIIFKYRFFLPQTSLTYPHFHDACARYTRLTKIVP